MFELLAALSVFTALLADAADPQPRLGDRLLDVARRWYPDPEIAILVQDMLIWVATGSRSITLTPGYGTAEMTRDVREVTGNPALELGDYLALVCDQIRRDEHYSKHSMTKRYAFLAYADWIEGEVVRTIEDSRAGLLRPRSRRRGELARRDELVSQRLAYVFQKLDSETFETWMLERALPEGLMWRTVRGRRVRVPIETLVKLENEDHRWKMLGELARDSEIDWRPNVPIPEDNDAL